MALRTINDSAHIHHVIRKRVQDSRRTMWWQTVTWQVYCHISALWKREQPNVWSSKCENIQLKLKDVKSLTSPIHLVKVLHHSYVKGMST